MTRLDFTGLYSTCPLQELFRWCLYSFTEQKWPVVKGVIMTCMHNAISDLSYYITIQRHSLQDVGREGLRAQLSPSWLYDVSPQHPTPVLLPGESHGQMSLAGYSPWGHKESDMTEAT